MAPPKMDDTADTAVDAALLASAVACSRMFSRPSL
jgi:hypothetical protein